MSLQSELPSEEETSISICHIIVDLDVGGAEMMLKRLIECYQNNNKFRHFVLTFKPVGKIGHNLRSLGIEVLSLNSFRFRDFPKAIWHLILLLRRTRPDIVQTWMYHADLVGGLASWIAGCRNIIWGIRGTLVPKKSWLTRLLVRICAKNSFWIPRVIVCCAESARVWHVSLGYVKKKMIVIPNGYDLTYFAPDMKLKRTMRMRLGIPENSLVIGTIGRFDTLKDYKNYILATRIVAKKIPSVKFLMLGRNIDVSNAVLMDWIVDSEFSDRFQLLGERDDVPSCLAAMDIFCLPSLAEGFPNVVAEAMCMQLPCVVTDVGDAAAIVGDAGIVVPPRNEFALAEALIFICKLPDVKRFNLGCRAREIINENYSIRKIEQLYSSLYLSLI